MIIVLIHPVLRGTVVGIRRAFGRCTCRKQASTLDRKNWTEVVVNITSVFSIPPKPCAQLRMVTSAGVDRDESSYFRLRSIWLVIFESHWLLCV
jgi:hypothetical protein